MKFELERSVRVGSAEKTSSRNGKIIHPDQ